MHLPHDDVDPGGLLEYSVVFTDRSLNHMSARFVGVMQELLELLRTTYGADSVAVVPGGGTYAMEAVARQLATGRRCLVVRNGFFSYRWSQILEQGAIAEAVTVCTARPTSSEPQSGWTPPPIDEVVATIERERPGVVFAAHVETAAGILLPDGTCVRSRRRRTRSGDCSCLTASPPVRSGSDGRARGRRASERTPERVERHPGHRLRDAGRVGT